jgi:hypothetical protein
MASYERGSKTVACLECFPEQSHAASSAASTLKAPPEDAFTTPGSEPQSVPTTVFSGSAGASARREYDRRKRKREARIREAHPYLGKLILAASDDPQSTRAWAIGARGEEVLGQRLDRLSGRGVHVLHDRRIPRTRANIDHIAVCPTGVFVIDAKKYQGRPSLRVEGGLIRPRTEKLIVGSRDCTKLIDGVGKQVNLVRSALEGAGLREIPVRGVLCFVHADWPLIGGHFTVEDIHVSWPKRVSESLLKPGQINDQTAEHIYRTLASAFPAA